MADGPRRPAGTPSGILRRALKNAGLLLTGKSASGLMQLATFALLARSLGLSEFGYFSIVLAQIQLLIVIATFQSNQAIVRYGVTHIHHRDVAAFHSLIFAGTTLDVIAGLLATGAALVFAVVVGAMERWPDNVVVAAEWLALLPLASAIATPKGMLRLLGRFDLLARHVTVTPACRLIGVAGVSMAGGGLLGFVFVWIAAGWAGGLAGLWLGWREAARAGLLGRISYRNIRPARDNPGIWSFALLSNFHSTLAALPNHLATYVVGLTLGATPAGLMKIAQELGTGLAKPIDLLNQAVYPDIARVVTAGEWRRVRRLVARAGIAAAAVSALVTLALLLVGQPAIAFIFGSAFTGAYWPLVLVSLATTFGVLVCAVDPMLYALGRPSRPLLTAVVGTLLFTAVLLFAVPRLGLIAGGLAYLAMGLATLIMSAMWMRLALPPDSSSPRELD